MLSIVLSTIAFVIASFFAKRYLEDMGIPKGMLRNLVVFCIATVISYGVSEAVDWMTPGHSASSGSELNQLVSTFTGVKN